MKISDEAVEAAAAKLYPDLFSGESLLPEVLRNSGRWQWRREVRAALEAAAPYLMPDREALRPVIDREAVRDVFVRFWNAVLCNSDVPGWTVQQEAEKARDAVMELARPMPTREQIAEAVYLSESQSNAHRPDWKNASPGVRALFYDIADAVVALFDAEVPSDQPS